MAGLESLNQVKISFVKLFLCSAYGWRKAHPQLKLLTEMYLFVKDFIFIIKEITFDNQRNHSKSGETFICETIPLLCSKHLFKTMTI